jgi:hypothetical protein
MRKRAFVISLIIILGIVVLSVVSHINSERGSVSIGFDLPDVQNMQASLNNKVLTIKGVQATYQLKPGTYDLTISKLNYRTVSTSFTVTNSHETVLTISPKRSIDTTISNWQEIDGSASYPSDVTLTVNQYFYQSTWAVGIIELDGGDPAVVILRYDDPLNKWEIADGPGTSFPSSTLSKLPNSVANYMQNSGNIETGE